MGRWRQRQNPDPTRKEKNFFSLRELRQFLRHKPLRQGKIFTILLHVYPIMKTGHTLCKLAGILVRLTERRCKRGTTARRTKNKINNSSLRNRRPLPTSGLPDCHTQQEKIRASANVASSNTSGPFGRIGLIFTILSPRGHATDKEVVVKVLMIEARTLGILGQQPSPFAKESTLRELLLPTAPASIPDRVVFGNCATTDGSLAIQDVARDHPK